jgi:hypothetical protein
MKKDKIIVIYSTNLSNDEILTFNIHISKTIGCDHEIYWYINHNEFSLTEIYNKGIKEHNKENVLMVFIHHDIVFKTKNWGKLLLNKFNFSNYSIMGVAGTTNMSESGRWWDDRSKMVGIVEHTDGMKTWVNEYCKPFHGIKDVVLIDGLFMAVDCNDIEFYFDEDFKGFHHYDTSFCIENYLYNVKIGVVTDIRVLHKSVGMTNDQWEENRKLFVEKYGDELPINI